MSVIVVPAWMARTGLPCHSMDPEVFHPLHDDSAEAALAVAACWRCPVRSDCLTWALDNGEHGVWGGTTEFERRQLKARKSRVKCPGCGTHDVELVTGGEICYRCGLSWLT